MGAKLIQPNMLCQSKVGDSYFGPKEGLRDHGIRLGSEPEGPLLSFHLSCPKRSFFGLDPGPGLGLKPAEFPPGLSGIEILPPEPVFQPGSVASADKP